jgi:toxin CcdB
VARLDIYTNPTASERAHTPFVLDVQNDHLGPLGTRVVVPLRAPRALSKPAHALNPMFEVEGKPVVLDTAAMAPVPASMLKRPIATAHRYQAELLDALDTLFGSY